MQEIIKQLLSDPRVVDVMTKVLAEMLQNINTQSMEQSAPQENMASISESKSVTTQQKTQKVIDWDSKTKPQLYAAYNYRIKHNIPFEPEFEAALIKHIPGYDSVQKVFKGRGGKRQKQTETTAKSDAQPVQTPDIRQSQEYTGYSTKTNTQLRALYTYRIKHNVEFTPAFQAILTDRFPTYNPELKKFTGRGGKRRKKSEITVKTDVKSGVTIIQSGKKTRVINWTEKTDEILWKAYEHRKNTGIDDALNAVLAERFPDEYDPVARKRIKKVKLHDSTTKRPKESDATPTAPQRRATAPVKKAHLDESPTQLSVKLKLVKQSLDTAFYDVYLNGRKILHNHANTELRLFADGTILGVHGIVTNNNHLPQRPLWLVYKPDTTQLTWSGYTKFTKYDVYVQQIGTSESDINLSLSDGSIRQLNIERLKRQAGLIRFEIER